MEYIYNYAIFYECFLEPIQTESIASKSKITKYILGLNSQDNHSEEKKEYSAASISGFTNGIQTLPKKIKSYFAEMSPDELTQIFKDNFELILSGCESKRQRDKLYDTLRTRLARFRELIDKEIIVLNHDIRDIYKKDVDSISKLAYLFNLAVQSESTFKESYKDPQFLFFLRKEIQKQPNQIYYEGLPSINLTAKLQPYEGCYLIYYFSQHYTEKVHTGLLRIFRTDDKGGFSALILFGVTDSEKLLEPDAIEIMNAETNYDAYKNYLVLHKRYEDRYHQRFYLYIGKVEATDSFLMIQAEGVDPNRREHRMVIFMNTVNMEQFIKKHYAKYKGGIALANSLPNTSTQKIRCFKMGISRIPLEQEDEQLKELLKHSITKRQRTQIGLDDDKDFYDYILSCEAYPSEKKSLCKLTEVLNELNNTDLEVI